MLAFFVCTSFLAAALLFSLEPMVGKMIVPLLGGSPAVWNTCMVFFQAALLAGYLYAHAALSKLGVRKAAVLHAAVALVVLLVLPVHLGEGDVSGWPAGANPVPRLLALLVLKVGPPFLVIAATAPLLQRWVSETGLRAGRDPYFLYAASNVGSLLALLLYPAVIERALGLRAQAQVWRWGYAVLAGLVLVCAGLVALRRGGAAREASPAEPGTPISRRARLRWMILAAVPAAMLIGATTYLGTDIASFPLLWVLPLAVYLLTFVFAFGTPRIMSTRVASLLLPLTLPAAFIFVVSDSSLLRTAALVIHLATLFLVGMVCHGRLADERPPPAQLTTFYLWIAGGGALGGAFAALVAPLLFDRVVEYPLEMIAACFLRPAPADNPGAGRPGRGDLAWAMSIAGLAGLMGLLVRGWRLPGPLAVGLMFGLPIAVHLPALARPARFAMGLAGLLVVSYLLPPSPLGRTLERQRTFFGTLRVTASADGQYRYLLHGTTMHGQQAVSEARRREPLAYFHRSGPLGQILTVASDPASLRTVAVFGMGIGTIAAYARPGQRWTFYEIDPAVVRIAKDTRFFTYLADAFPGGAGLRIEVGDGRLRLREAPDASFDLIVLDAFSSDAIPVHLLAREALSLYQRKLAAGGLLAFNISSRYLDLQPVVAALVHDAGFVALCWDDTAADRRNVPGADREGKLPSVWCVAARDAARLAGLGALSQWRPPRTNDNPVWTDDRSSLVEALR